MTRAGERAGTPPRMAVVLPDYETDGRRRRLVGIDETLVVNRLASGVHLFDLRPYVDLTRDRADGARRALARMAEDVAAGRTLVILDRDRLLRELERSAADAASERDGASALEAAAAIRERLGDAVLDPCDTAGQRRTILRSIGGRPRQIVPAADPDAIEVMRGAPILRAETLWHAVVHNASSVRDRQHARAAWQRWAAADRPDMPRHAV